MDPNEMDSFVLIVGQRKSVTKAVKDVMDLASYFDSFAFATM